MVERKAKGRELTHEHVARAAQHGQEMFDCWTLTGLMKAATFMVVR